MKKFLTFHIALLLTTMAMAQWTSDPSINTMISKKNQNIYGVEIKVHTNGDVYLYYQFPEAETICSYLQILSKDGVKKLGEGGLLISNHKTRSWTIVNDHLIVDDEGNAIIAIQDCRNSEEQTNGDLSYSAYKISPSGEFLWGKDGIDLAKGESYNLEGVMRLIQVGDQYMFAWFRAGSMGNPPASSFSLYKSGIYSSSPLTTSEKADGEEPSYIVMERLDKSGKFVGETKYLKDNSIPYNYPWLVNAGNGQVILVYAKGTNQDLMARKLDFDGSSVWAQDAIVYRGGFGSIPIWTFVNVYEDPNSGVFVSWHDDRNYTNIESAYLSHIKSDGTYGYAAGMEGQQLGFSGLRQFAPEVVYNPSDQSTYAIWRETSGSQVWERICAQRLTKEGDLMWNIEGVDVYPLSESNVGYYSCQLDDQNRLTAFFLVQDSIVVAGKTKAYACLFEPSGKYAWGDDTKYAFISNATSEKSDLASSPLAQNQWAFVWKDSRREAGSIDPIIYGQNMHLNGSLGNTVGNEILNDAISGFHMYPNPVQNTANFLVQVKGNSKVNISVFNALGQKINTVFDGNLGTGAHEFSWNASSANKGIYFVVVNNGGKTGSFKLICQ